MIQSKLKKKKIINNYHCIHTKLLVIAVFLLSLTFSYPIINKKLAFLALHPYNSNIHLSYYYKIMRTELTIKLRKITDIASTLNRSIFSEYDKCSWTERWTFLCALFSVLWTRISQVNSVMYTMELWSLYTNIVNERKALWYNSTEITVYNPRMQEIMKRANKTVDQIMLAIKEYVENPSKQLSFTY